MSEIVFIEQGKVVTDSLTVAELFGKRHDNVIRDIENQMLFAGEEFSSLNFEESKYETRGKQYPKYNLTEEGFTLIVFGYNTKEAIQTKIKFIQEFKRMREQLQPRLPQTFAEALRLAADLEEERQKLVTKNLMLEQQVAEAEPKLTYYDKILNSTNLLTVTQIAKDYGLSGQALNKILNNSGVQYKQSGQWLLYTKHADKGFTKSQTIIDGKGEPRLNTKWTQKGRLFIHSILTNLGYDPDEIKKPS